MLRLGVWQFSRGFVQPGPGEPTQYHLLNIVYGFQWWIFAVFAAWFWWRFLRDQKRTEDEEYQRYLASQGQQ